MSSRPVSWLGCGAGDPLAAASGRLLIGESIDTGDLDLGRRADGSLSRDPTLATAVTCSLFCDAPLDDERRAALGIDDRRGYWADAFTQGGRWGSLLWTLDRSSVTPETARIAEGHAREALDWMIACGMARSVEVTGTAVQGDAPRVELAVRITRPPSKATRFGDVWEATYALH